MKLSTIVWNALVATSVATSHAAPPNSPAALLSPDPSPQSLLKATTSLLSHLPWPPSSKSPPTHPISRRDAQNNNADDAYYASAYAEAQALGLVGGFRQAPTTPTQRRTFNIAHGTLMALTFTLWLPLGAVAMHATHNVVLHAAAQSFAYANAIAGLGLGVWLGRNVRYLDYAHTVIGMAVLAALVFQVALGVWAHWGVVAGREREMQREMERDTEMPMPVPATTGSGKGVVMRMRGIFTRGFAHRWLGRCLIALGIVNGGLGLKLAQNTKGGEIAYGIVAGLVGATYLTLLLIRSWRRYRMTEEPMAPQGGMLT